MYGFRTYATPGAAHTAVSALWVICCEVTHFTHKSQKNVMCVGLLKKPINE